MDKPNGVLVHRCFRILNAKHMGLMITLVDIREEEFQVMELIETDIETERQKEIRENSGTPSYTSAK